MASKAQAEITLVALVAAIRAEEKDPMEHQFKRASEVRAARRIAGTAGANLRKKQRADELHDPPSWLGETA